MTVFGLVAVSLMLVCYALEDRGAGYILAFSWACLLASAYGFFQGAWPFGLIEAIWTVVAIHRWWTVRREKCRPHGADGPSVASGA